MQQDQSAPSLQTGEENASEMHLKNDSQLAGRKRPHEDMSIDPALNAASVQHVPPEQVQRFGKEAGAVPSTAPGAPAGRAGARILNHVNPFEIFRGSKRDLNWDIQYEALVSFANRHGHCNVRSVLSGDTEDRSQINLYAWLALQRRHRKAGRLRQDREKKLQLLVDQGKLSWVGADTKNEDEDLVQPPPPLPPAWNSYFGALLAFAEDHGHANVPLGYMSFIERRRSLDLGAWVRLQRQMMASGKLPENQKELLNTLVNAGMFSWTPHTSSFSSLPQYSLDTNWNLQFKAVTEYADKHKSCNVTEPGTLLTTSLGNSFDLGMWVICQRSRYKLRILAPDRLVQLAGLVEKGHFAWMSPEEAQARAEEREKKSKEEETLWNAWYNVLVWYGRHNGHCNLGATDTVSLPDESEAELGKWLDIQKRYLAKSRLKPDRVEKLRRLVDEQKLPIQWIHDYAQLAHSNSSDSNASELALSMPKQGQASDGGMSELGEAATAAS